VVEFACLSSHAMGMFKDVRTKEVNAHPLLGPELFSNCASRTWRLTSGPALEPAELLRKECEGASLKSDEFVVPALGEAVVF